ncbi:MAG: type IV pilus assembly protein PilM [Candidatus Omnitrophica bacterium]|nr:type IV pilus assembly protein PilM [Candidatus Omnitrophota bacterium]
MFRPLASFQSLLKQSASSIGLDIGSTSVKGLILRQTSPSLKTAQAAFRPLAPGAGPSERTKAMEEVLQALNANSVPVTTAVGGQGAVLRWVVLPKMTPQELKTSLAFEAEKHIPFKLTEAYLDFAILGDRPAGRMEILLAAARKELVDGHLEAVKTSGIHPKAIDLEAAALANAWNVGPPVPKDFSGVSVLLHVGARGTIINFLVGDRLHFSREIPYGGDIFTQQIAEALGVDAPSAEGIKCSPGEKEPQVKQALLSRWEEWLAQCRLSFDFYESQSGRGVERLVLSGGSAPLSGFKEWIAEASGLPTELWNPVAAFSNCLDPGMLKEAARWGVALGLAARGLPG